MGMQSNKRILVTGGAGFVGVNLCQQLLAQGNHVICLDNFFTSNKSNIQHLIKNKNFEFVEHDVCSSFNFNVQEIYHLACPASPPHYQRDPIYTAKINFLGALNALECAKASNAKVLLSSTSEVYGNPLEHPQKESYLGNVNPIGPRACYDEGKRISETLFFDSQRQWNANIRVARIFNTYGPHMQADDGRVVSNFIIQALKEEPLSIYGNGKQTRSFCYVEDTVRGLITLMNSEYKLPVNIGNPLELTVSKIAEEIITLTHSQSKIDYHPLPQDDPLQRKPDISIANNLGWQPTIKLADGLEQTIAYFSKHLEKVTD
jgi:UDP-glucuronate decarboxylase